MIKNCVDDALSTRALPGGVAKKSVYISGGITDVPNYREHFAHAEQKLSAEGWMVVNPATLNLGPGATWEAYMKLCIPMLCPCDEIYMLPGWEASRGAKEERRTAKMLGIPVTYADERSAVAFPDKAAA